jgi:2-isopropylmalate synthase
MSVAQKLEVGRRLEALGVDVIETGFPAASENDFRTTVKLSTAVKNTRLCVFARALASDIQTAFDAVHRAPAFKILVMTTSSDIHLQKKRSMSRGEALQEAAEGIRFARSLGFADIIVGPEDATRANKDFLHRMVDVSVEAGATTVCVPDTVGACLPGEYGDLIQDIRSWIGSDIRISAHTHNDLGLAVANALAAVQADADECQVTLCGIGERAGNAALEEVVAAIVNKPTHFQRSITIDTSKIWSTCFDFLSMLKIPMSRSKSIVGANAFATSAGIHQSGIIRDPKTYEFLDPASFGTTRQLMIARHSGRDALRAKLTSLGIPTDMQTLQRVYDRMKGAESVSVFSDSDLLNLAGLT